MERWGSHGSTRQNSGRRKLVAAVAVLPVLAALAASGLSATRGASRELACWVLPNARVVVAPGDQRCPLRSHDWIRKVEVVGGEVAPVDDSQGIDQALSQAGSSLRVTVSRAGREYWAEVPIRELSFAERVGRVAAAALVAGILLSIPMFVLWRSTSRAAVPFALLYSAIAVCIVTLICGRQSGWLARGSLLAMISAPPILVHLSFVFPRERKVIRDRPELTAVPYVLGGFLVPMGWLALERNPLLWPSFTYLLLALTAGTWAILIASCGFAVRESTSAIERARARLLCYGALLVPVIPTLWFVGERREPVEIVTAYLWISAIVMLLPLGLAISHYNLFDLGWHVRRFIARLLYLGTAALVVTLGFEASFTVVGAWHPLRDPAPVFGVSFACVVAIELLRGRMLGFVEAVVSPRLDRLRDLRERYEHELAQLQEDDSVALHLGEILREGLKPRTGCVFLSAVGEWRPAFPFGAGPPVQTSLVPEALAALGERRLVHFALEAAEDAGTHASLDAQGVEMVALIESGGERLGVVLLGTRESRAPYTGIDLDFVAMACSQAGIALRNTRLTADLLASERNATTSRVALALAHDLGKELDWVRRLIRRLPQRLDDRERLLRDVAMLRDFSEGLVEDLRDFVDEATRPQPGSPEILRFDEMIERATRRTIRVHGPDRIAQSIDPNLRRLCCHENLGRVISNLLDNALHATPKPDPVRLSASLEGERIRVSIVDSGCGIPEDHLAEVFSPGFSTRAEEGGLGIGLTVAHEIVAALGGTIELTANDEGGMQATVRVPATLQEQT